MLIRTDWSRGEKSEAALLSEKRTYDMYPSDIQTEPLMPVLLKSLSAVFPAAVVEACIRDALANEAADQAVLRPGRGTTTVAPIVPRAWEPEIDSLVAVEVICAIEDLLGIELPATFAPKGGYDSTQACIDDLVSEAKIAWDDETKEKKKP